MRGKRQVRGMAGRGEGRVWGDVTPTPHAPIIAPSRHPSVKQCSGVSKDTFLIILLFFIYIPSAFFTMLFLKLLW